MKIEDKLIIEAGKKQFFIFRTGSELQKSYSNHNNDFYPNDWVFIDEHTTERIKQLQSETNKEIEILIRKNLDRTIPLTEENKKELFFI